MRKIAFIFAALMLAACTGAIEIPVPDGQEPDSAVSATLLRCIPSSDPSLQELAPVPAIPEPSTVTAGFASGTRTYLQSSGDVTKVLWSSGDGFDGIWTNSSASNFSYSRYTTSGSGAAVDFTSDYSLPSGKLFFFYPEVGKSGNSLRIARYNSRLAAEVRVPVEQTAIPGNVADGVNVAYAFASSDQGNLTFHNFPSLLRFRITGSVVPDVVSVRLQGSQQLAGDVIFLPDSAPAEIPGVSFEGAVTSASVTLSGTFVAGQEYYIALIPSTQSMRLVFSDAAGNSTTKVAGKEIEFAQGRIIDIGTVNLGSKLEDAKPKDPDLYMSASSGRTPVSIAVIPEGFRESEMSTYETLAHNAIDALMDTEPYRSYREYFNVWILFANSKESGASVTDGNGNITQRHNTYFGAKWGASSYGDMAASGDVVYGFVQENCPDIVSGMHSIDEVPIMMIINDSRFGGICHSTSVGRGYAMVPYTDRGGGLAWGFPDIIAVSDSDPSAGVRKVTNAEKQELRVNNGDWRNTAIHEFGGHCFGRLADEYWYTSVYPATSSLSVHTWTVPFGLNVSATYSNPPWKADLLDNLDNLIARDSRYSRIGVYQGGDNSPLNRWRSEIISCMIDNRKYFSTWQRELIVKRIMKLAGATFSLSDFFAKDVTEDPLRDAVASPVAGHADSRTYRPVPPLPPPVFDY